MDRFDDVESRIVEEPAARPVSRRQWRLGHAAIALTAAAVLAGSLAAGASALTSTADAPTRPAAKSLQSKDRDGWRDGKCREKHRRAKSALNY
jgi:hypothetical protein